MDWQELRETTMDPAERTLLQVTLDNAAAADEIFSILMGRTSNPAAASSSAMPATSASSISDAFCIGLLIGS